MNQIFFLLFDLQKNSNSYLNHFYYLIKSFYKLSGFPVILNTSFNLHGSPIVWNPKNAIDTFNNSKLDAIALGNYLIKKN